MSQSHNASTGGDSPQPRMSNEKLRLLVKVNGPPTSAADDLSNLYKNTASSTPSFLVTSRVWGSVSDAGPIDGPGVWHPYLDRFSRVIDNPDHARTGGSQLFTRNQMI
ncbi:hypothetical protein FRB95_007686 [Tulasnella sp. JGI-2019a]|nr:hypothetical protein FRB95_007686 [Tulasnella sp. JGI-2019a]